MIWTEETKEQLQDALGLGGLPYKIASLTVCERFNEPTTLEVTFSRELTPTEAAMVGAVMRGEWR
jgi:hypothetical protein